MNRRIATLALLVWYACVAIVGPGLHEVLGCEHYHHHGPAASAGLSGPVVLSAQAGALDVSAAHDADDDDDDCPLCKLLCMAQTAPVVVRPIWMANVLPIRVWFSYASIAAAPRSLCQIRGPPTALPTL
jgi:hypothetical protein